MNGDSSSKVFLIIDIVILLLLFIVLKIIGKCGRVVCSGIEVIGFVKFKLILF